MLFLARHIVLFKHQIPHKLHLYSVLSNLCCEQKIHVHHLYLLVKFLSNASSYCVYTVFDYDNKVDLNYATV